MVVSGQYSIERGDVAVPDDGIRQDVAEVLVRYASGIDRRDWALFRTCFTDDCEAVTPTGGGAVARSYVDAVLMSADSKTGFRTMGFYDDELVRTDDGWKIARRRFTMVHLESVGTAGPT